MLNEVGLFIGLSLFVIANKLLDCAMDEYYRVIFEKEAKERETEYEREVVYERVVEAEKAPSFWKKLVTFVTNDLETFMRKHTNYMQIGVIYKSLEDIIIYDENTGELDAPTESDDSDDESDEDSDKEEENLIDEIIEKETSEEELIEEEKEIIEEEQNEEEIIEEDLIEETEEKNDELIEEEPVKYFHDETWDEIEKFTIDEQKEENEEENEDQEESRVISAPGFAIKTRDIGTPKIRYPSPPKPSPFGVKLTEEEKYRDDDDGEPHFDFEKDSIPLKHCTPLTKSNNRFFSFFKKTKK